MRDSSDEWRQEVIARNEASFRAINERLEADLRQLPPTLEPQRFICECGSRSCQDTVLLTLDEYESVRARADHFAVLPGHVFFEAETVAESHERYLVVEKTGVGVDVSRATNPRD